MKTKERPKQSPSKTQVSETVVATDTTIGKTFILEGLEHPDAKRRPWKIAALKS